MKPTNIINPAEIERLIKDRPREADALAAGWQEFVQKHPKTLSFERKEEFDAWAAQNPEINIDTNIWIGREITEVYFYLREQHERLQAQIEGKVNPRSVPRELLALPILALAFSNRPRIIEDDKDYQKIALQLKKDWLEKNPGKDFTSKEWLDYRYGSLDDDRAPTLNADAKKIFRTDPRYSKRVERYNEEEQRIYENLDDDPKVTWVKREIDEHIKARGGYFKTHEEDKKPEDIARIIQNQSWGRFEEEHRKKAEAYAEKSEEENDKKSDLENARDIVRKKIRETIERKARESIQEKFGQPKMPEAIRPQPSAYQTKVPTSRAGFFNRGGRAGGRIAASAGRIGGRFAAQAGMAVGKGAVATVANPVGLIVIGVIILIIIIVFLIVLLAGEPRYTVPTYECVDAEGNRVLVTDGNACALLYAAFYSKQTGLTITAKCLDKCTDPFLVGLVCDRNPANNLCDSLPASCGAEEHWCFEYTPPVIVAPGTRSSRRHDCANLDGFDYGGLVGFTVISCNMSPVTPTPTPTP